MDRRLALVFVPAIVVAALISNLTHSGAQTACKAYRVDVPLLHVRKDPSAPGSYISALVAGEVACVSNTPRVGVNAYVDHKSLPDGRQVPVGGWANITFMSPLDGRPGAQPPGPGTTDQTSSADTDGDNSLKEAQTPLRFDQPIPYGASQVRGKSIKELAQGVPMFSPLEGLPETVWQKPCTSCHKWTQQALCDQGKSYIPRAAEIFRHPHPYGGAYKLSLMRWAATGCQ